MDKYDVIVIGGGPAGLMSAIVAARNNASVLVLEKNDSLGKKLLISGGGRCNLTNADLDIRSFLSKFGKQGQFLFSPFSVFGIKDTLDFFHDLGLETKTEPGLRVFPISDDSQSVLNSLIIEAKKLGVKFELNVSVSSLISKADKIVGVQVGKKLYSAKNYILAVGGKSHPETGSTGDGFIWLRELNHTINQPEPSLVPLKIKEKWVGELSGLSLDKAGVSVWQNNQMLGEKMGKTLFTHFGLSGPSVLNLSKIASDALKKGMVEIKLDLLVGQGLDKIDEELKKVISRDLNKMIKNVAWSAIPNKIWPYILTQVGIDPEKTCNVLTREERFALINSARNIKLTVTGLLGFDKAIISSGGLVPEEVDFRTMASKLYGNLFIVGDVLDFDRPSGGYSLQLCWTTGYVAGRSAAGYSIRVKNN
ncbi:MAG: NAD(P)/FAD-dependent oxidoreductase [bacterium]